ncbi:MAG: hypothetical protein LRZ92_00220, partial [Methanosarcinaceae archaeon]|nr:hypothetical protein [Methanosarcinaceae archaeon]
MKIICGFNINIDAIYTINSKEASQLLSKYPQKKLKFLPKSINSISDFINGLAFCMQNGMQAELLIQNKSVYQFLKDTFLKKSIIRIGGNAGIMANVLSFKGANVILQAQNSSDTTFSLMLEKNNIIINSDASKSNNCKEYEINFIFDFKKNDKISFKNKTITIPRENRFIASNTNTNYSINSDFKKYIDTNINEIDGAIFSGFHVLSKEKYKEFIEYVKSIKQKNKNILIHVELGHFIESEFDEISFIFSKLSKSVDSIGMNESELAALFKRNHDEILNMDAQCIIDAAIECKSFSNLKKIIIHTREFVISIFDSTFGTNVRWRKPK